MSTEHPITPPPELVEQWSNVTAYDQPVIDNWVTIATQAARWGADQELEASIKLLSELGGDGEMIRRHRRPKSPSLKEQALATLEAMEKLWESCGDNPTDIIRCALEALPDD